MCEKKEERMISYAKIVENSLRGFSKADIIQILMEGNAEADKLARIASAVEGIWSGDIVLLNAEVKSCVLEVLSIEMIEDWRTLIIQALKSITAEGIEGTARRALLVKKFIMGNFLYKRSFTHSYLRCLSEQEGEYIL